MLDKFFQRLGLVAPDNSKEVVGGIWLGQLVHEDKLYPLADYSVRIELIDDGSQGQVAYSLESPPARVLGTSSWLSTGNVAQWNTFVPLFSDSGAGAKPVSVSKASLRLSVHEDGVFTPETLMAVATMSCSDQRDAVDTNKLLVLPLRMGPTLPRKKPGHKHLFEENTTVSVKLFSPAMFATVTALAAHKRECLAFAGDLDTCSRLHGLWEMFVAHLIPFEGDRPIVVYAAMPSAARVLCAVGKGSPLLEGIPDSVREECEDGGGATEMLALMEEWCRLHRSKDAAAIVVSPHKQWSVAQLLEEVTRIRSLLGAPQDVLEALWEEAGKSGVRTVGVVGGMGPVAGAEFGRRLGVKLGGGGFEDVKVLMLSDPTTEQWKESVSDIPASTHATLRVLSFLSAPYLRHSCVASNTFHLVAEAVGRPRPMLSIFDACADRCIEEHASKKVGLMCTTPSMVFADTHGYGKTFASHRGDVIEWVRPTDEVQEKTMQAITLVKNPAGSVRDSYLLAGALMLDVVRWYAGQGATVMAMCCTEIPLVLTQEDVDDDPELKAKGVAVLDSAACLADYVHAALVNRTSAYPLAGE